MSHTAAHVCSLLLLGRYQKADYWVKKGTVIDWEHLSDVIQSKYPSPTWFDYDNCTVKELEHLLWKYSCVSVNKIVMCNKRGLSELESVAARNAFDIPRVVTKKGKDRLYALVRVWSSKDDACDLILVKTHHHSYIAYRDQFRSSEQDDPSNAKPMDPKHVLESVIDNQHIYKWRWIV